MDELERINFVEKILVDTEAIMKSIDEMYYKKKFDEIEKYKSIKDVDIKFRRCRELLIKNMKSLKESLDVNFNLFLALQVHLAVMNKEMQKLDEDPITVKQSESDSE